MGCLKRENFFEPNFSRNVIVKYCFLFFISPPWTPFGNPCSKVRLPDLSDLRYYPSKYNFRIVCDLYDNFTL